MLHNRIVGPFIYEALDARDWSVSKLAAESGTKRSVIAAQLSGARKIQPSHLMKYARVFNHQDGLKLLIAWLRDNIGQEMTQEFLNAAGDDLSDEVKAWTPPLDDEDNRRLAWWAREMAHDGELEELFKLLSARAGYHPRRTATGPVKRRRRH